MSKKQLQVGGIMNELEGASLFFTKTGSNTTPPPSPLPAGTLITSPETDNKPEFLDPTPHVEETAIPIESPKENNHPIKPKSVNASKLASTSLSKSVSPVESIRKIVKQVGKEVFFVRVTPEEKHTLTSIVYAFNEIYRDQGRKTSENEIGRIALNYLLEDYRANGNNSLLAQMLAALNA